MRKRERWNRTIRDERGVVGSRVSETERDVERDGERETEAHSTLPR